MQPDDLELHVFRLEQATAVRKALDTLAPRARLVIVARFGLDDRAPRTLDETAFELAQLDGYTVGRERIRQIERKALRHLAKPALGLQDVADVKPPPKPFNVPAFMAHQQVLKAERAAAARRDQELDARIAAARERQATPPPIPPPLPPWRAAVAALGLFAWPQQSPPSHYDWMQRADDLARWRAGGRPVNPFDWMKS